MRGIIPYHGSTLFIQYKIAQNLKLLLLFKKKRKLRTANFTLITYQTIFRYRKNFYNQTSKLPLFYVTLHNFLFRIYYFITRILQVNTRNAHSLSQQTLMTLTATLSQKELKPLEN